MEPPVLRDLGRIIRAAHFVVKQFASRFPEQTLQFSAGRKQRVVAIQLKDEVRDTPQQRLQSLRPSVVIQLFMVRHRLPSPDVHASSQVYGRKCISAAHRAGKKHAKSRCRSSLRPSDKS